MQISVITPVFNAARFIAQCVANVAMQGDAVLEHIIVDGGSTDGTLETIATLRAAHPKLRLIGGPDRGQSDAMNKGTAAARGEAIGMLNVDDFYEAGAVREGSDALARQHGPAIVVGDCRVLDETGQTKYWNRPHDLRPEKLLQFAPDFPLPVNPSAYFYTKSLHDLVGGYDVDNHYSMDIDFLLRGIRHGSYAYVPRHWGNFRLIPGCKSFENREANANPLHEIIARHRRQATLRERVVIFGGKARWKNRARTALIAIGLRK